MTNRSPSTPIDEALKVLQRPVEGSEPVKRDTGTVPLEAIAGDQHRKVTFPPMSGSTSEEAAIRHRTKKKALLRDPE
jgi:hypothetical protein